MSDESDVESGGSEDEQSDSEEESMAKTIERLSKTTPSSKPLISFDSAKKAFQRFKKNLDVLSKKSKFNKREEKLKQDVIFNKYFESIEREACSAGLDEEIIALVWEIASDPNNLMVKKNKTALIYSMIPNKLLKARFVASLLYWLDESRKLEPRLRNAIKVPILEYMIVTFEYQLIEEDVFSSPIHFSILMRELENEFGIKTLCGLIKMVAKKEILNLTHIVTIRTCLMRSKKQSVNNVLFNLFKLFRASRPDLVIKDAIEIKRVDRTKNFDVVKPGLKTKFYEAKGRILKALNSNDEEIEIDLDVVEKLKRSNYVLSKLSLQDAERVGNRIFFPEFGNFNTESIFGKMLAIFRDPNKLVEFYQDPLKLYLFNIWLDMNLQHKFNSYEKERSFCYEIIFDRCFRLITTFNIELEPLNNWLITNLYEWDGHLFQDQIFSFIPYIKIFKMKKHGLFFEKLKFMFLFEPNEVKLKIWSSLSELFINWVKDREVFDPSASDNNSDYIEGVEIEERQLHLFFKFLFNLVKKLFIVRPFMPHSKCTLLSEMCKSFISFQIFESSTIEVLPPIELFYMILLSNSPMPLEKYCQFYLERVQPQKRKKSGMTLIEKELEGFFKTGEPFIGIEEMIIEMPLNSLTNAQKGSIVGKRRMFSVLDSSLLQMFRTHSTGDFNDPLEELFEMKLLQDVFPNIAQCLNLFKRAK